MEKVLIDYKLEQSKRNYCLTLDFIERRSHLVMRDDTLNMNAAFERVSAVLGQDVPSL